MFNKDRIEFYMTKKGWTKYRLAKEADIGQSTLSEILSGKKKNPSINTLQKIASALDVTVDKLTDEQNTSGSLTSNENFQEELNDFEEFKTPEAAMQFIVKQPALAAYGGYDINKMTNNEILEFANELLSQLKLLGYKYKK
ncbi:XRE family transcriptional regulator [Clostridium acetobutylicum]|nr:XRE family transcriptional regulator [Clostridium acetobutylicum]